jgi:hypothetical protein
MIDQFFTDTDDLASELATDIANAFRYKAKQLGADDQSPQEGADG